MRHLAVDVAVIGAGSAGLTAYRAARSQGASVVLIERGPYGTTCARVGCMPSKLLIAAAEAAHAVSQANYFGVQTMPPRIDGKQVMARLRSERDRFVGFVLDGIAQIDPVELLTGSARFLGPQQLQVDAHTVVAADRIVIATGSQPLVPPMLAGLGDRVQTNDQVFDWDDLPTSVAVVGAGVIGLELGQALHRLGVQVTIYARTDRLGPLTDPEVLRSARHCIGGELALRLGVQSLTAQRDGDGVRIDSIGNGGVASSDQFALVLSATGRRPNLSALALSNSGLALDDQGIPLYDRHTMQCGSSPIFIAGDADDERPLLHEAVDQGRIAGVNAAGFPRLEAGLRRAALGIVFSDPQIALVGASFRSLVAHSFAIGEVDFAGQGRSRVMLQNRGLLRVYGAFGSGLFLGAEMIGPRAEHLAHLLAWACQAKMTVTQMLEMPFYHPVIEEGVRTALRDLQEKIARGSPALEHCADCTPGM